MRGRCLSKQCGLNNGEAALLPSQRDVHPIWDGLLKWTLQVARHQTSVNRHPLTLAVVYNAMLHEATGFLSSPPSGLFSCPNDSTLENVQIFIFFPFKLILKGQHFICNSVGGKDWCWVTRGATDVDFQGGT